MKILNFVKPLTISVIFTILAIVGVYFGDQTYVITMKPMPIALPLLAISAVIWAVYGLYLADLAGKKHKNIGILSIILSILAIFLVMLIVYDTFMHQGTSVIEFLKQLTLVNAVYALSLR